MKSTKQAFRSVSSISTVLFVAMFILLAAPSGSRSEQPLNVQLTLKAWKAFNEGKWELAIQKAEQCTDEFVGAAGRQQAKLEEARIPPPVTGKPTKKEKATILERGPLNDVATCYYIKGRAAEKLGNKDMARQAYIEASKLTYGRCWDPKGWFWSPAEVSTDRLQRLK